MAYKQCFTELHTNGWSIYIHQSIFVNSSVASTSDLPSIRAFVRDTSQPLADFFHVPLAGSLFLLVPWILLFEDLCSWPLSAFLRGRFQRSVSRSPQWRCYRRTGCWSSCCSTSSQCFSPSRSSLPPPPLRLVIITASYSLINNEQWAGAPRRWPEPCSALQISVDSLPCTAPDVQWWKTDFPWKRQIQEIQGCWGWCKKNLENLKLSFPSSPAFTFPVLSVPTTSITSNLDVLNID